VSLSGPGDLSSTRLQVGSITASPLAQDESKDEGKGVQEPESPVHRPSSTRKGESHCEMISLGL